MSRNVLQHQQQRFRTGNPSTLTTLARSSELFWPLTPCWLLKSECYRPWIKDNNEAVKLPQQKQLFATESTAACQSFRSAPSQACPSNLPLLRSVTIQPPQIYKNSPLWSSWPGIYARKGTNQRWSPAASGLHPVAMLEMFNLIFFLFPLYHNWYWRNIIYIYMTYLEYRA